MVKDGYAIIPDALQVQLPSQLKNIAESKTNFKDAGISSFAQMHTNALCRRDKTSWLDEDSSYQSEFLLFTKSLQETLNKKLYLGIQYYESHFSIYSKDDFYEKHLDAFIGKKTRVISTVYYLNDTWGQDDGGELLLYDLQNNLLNTIVPRSNTLVVFLSEEFPHEVLPAKKKRFSIAGWFRVDR